MRYRRRILWNLLSVALAVGAWVTFASIVSNQLPARARNTAIVALAILVMAGMRHVARKVAGPIERMTEATRRFGAGELSYRLPEPPAWWHKHRRRHRGGQGKRPWDEVVELGRSWNEMAERIERLVRGQKELLASVSHDLRSPLARVRVALELLPREGGAEAKIGEIEQDLGDLDRMIDDILTASRLDAATAPARLERVSIPGLVDDVVRKARALGAEVHSSVALEGAGEVDADGALLRRALGNLVENAVKHGAPPITVSAQAAGGELCLRVTDGGPGIPEAERERVLEPFARGDRARTPREGSGVGLGLTIARRVAEVHGGRLALEDAETGCRVALYIPLTH